MQEKSRVLIVDDERELADILALTLSKRGFEVAVAYGGFDAIKVAESFTPDLILSDIKMPNGSGIELLRAMNSKHANPPPFVLLMTGYTDISEEQLLSEGAIKVFEKPVPMDKLVEFIAGAIKNRTCV